MNRSKTKVHFFSLDTPTKIKNVSGLKYFVESIFRKEKRKLSAINYIFCDDKTILKINKRYLNHDFFTDVITFELSQENEPLMAEVYISVDRVKDNAKELGVSLKSELHRVIFHAALHLCGYNDKKKRDVEIMRNKEEELLSIYL